MRYFGKKREGEGELKQLVGIAIGSGNEVYVSEWENNRISIFSNDGEFIKSFGRQVKWASSVLRSIWTSSRQEWSFVCLRCIWSLADLQLIKSFIR